MKIEIARIPGEEGGEADAKPFLARPLSLYLENQTATDPISAILFSVEESLHSCDAIQVYVIIEQCVPHANAALLSTVA
jgi:hypothetical protein